MPKRPWKKVHTDFYRLLPSGDNLLFMIDRYPRLLEAEIIRSIKSSVVISKLGKNFSVHGIPETVKTDNGPPFSGDDFDRYLKTLGITYEPSTPCWPQANGEVERFNQPSGKSFTDSGCGRKSMEERILSFLSQYRTTPHSTTKVVLCELMLNRLV